MHKYIRSFLYNSRPQISVYLGLFDWATCNTVVGASRLEGDSALVVVGGCIAFWHTICYGLGQNGEGRRLAG